MIQGRRLPPRQRNSEPVLLFLMLDDYDLSFESSLVSHHVGQGQTTQIPRSLDFADPGEADRRLPLIPGRHKGTRTVAQCVEVLRT